ncbi:MAG: TIGR04282 family arsenosugar biosynthesis glycosyltransferase [Gemmatimonadales bacterium]
MNIHLAVLLEAPRPGFVKTRLAAEIGQAQAVRVYRVIASRTLALIKALGRRATIWYAPAEAREEMRRWLGADWDLRPQASGDLGARFAAAAGAVERGGWWIGLGGDCPGLTPEILRQAFHALDHHEVVLGPRQDGGYYLIGGTVPLPDIFSDMPWSTNRLLDETRSRLAGAGVVWAEVPALRDVETAADARATGLLT